MKRTVRILLITALMIIMSCTTVMADNKADIQKFMDVNAPIIINGNSVREAGSGWYAVSDYFSIGAPSGSKTSIIKVSYSDGVFQNYFYDSQNEEDILSAIKNSSVSEKSMEEIKEITNGLSIKADTQGATKILSGGIPIVNIIIGLIIIAVILLLGLYTCTDILYLAFPMFRSMADSKKESGKSGMLVKQSVDGDAQFRFISDDAVRAYQQSIVDGGNRQPYIKYICSRLWAYIMLSVIITIFLTGNQAVFINIGVRVGQGIIDLISNL